MASNLARLRFQAMTRFVHSVVENNSSAFPAGLAAVALRLLKPALSNMVINI
jgi:hypothetical protein